MGVGHSHSIRLGITEFAVALFRPDRLGRSAAAATAATATAAVAAAAAAAADLRPPRRRKKLRPNYCRIVMQTVGDWSIACFCVTPAIIA